MNDIVKNFEGGNDNYTVKKEYHSKWGIQFFRIGGIKYDEVGNKIVKLNGLNKAYLRHEISKL